MIEDSKTKSGKSSREAQTFYRVTFKNNIGLLHIADNKANMLISINTLVISAIIAISGYGAIANQFEEMGLKVVLPVGLILVFCLISTALAVQAAKPKIISKDRKPYQPEKGSLIFFGESARLSLNNYLDEISKVLTSKNEMNEQMSIALYQQGVVLDSKYRLLGYAYSLFILGIAMGTMAFVLFMFIS
ncbi:MAG: metal-dependent phosphohydrolase [Mongoliibacter sp.]|jgi:hypothetical protein|uniref:Pycsar system effector family protein n=1 Tax=Mongoliibacter sp. TaxID=2022438 RepID=UPI0012EFBD2D|nr:Pycsar system effector family protein [Mongoliibacter sp.]TVP43070.1 MAG: metal-dependent phosphohydrolase [Mongoliibacter sp.]